MRNPTDVLKILTEKASIKDYKFKRIYRNLYNPNFYLLACQRIYANNGSMTAGVDGLTIDGMSEKRIIKLINSLKDYSYQPKPARRVYIKKRSGNKKRPLGIPSFEDKLLQEVVKMILESIYEPNFSECSHGFRPNRSCHTALADLQAKFTGAKWFIEGDIKACFDCFDHHIIINILRKRIDDESFISLMWKMLKAGYMEQWKYNTTYCGTPQGSGCSPILANIYLNELDNFMNEYKQKFDIGNKQQKNPEYIRLDNKARRYKQKYDKSWKTLTEEEQKEHAKIYKSFIMEKLKVNLSIPSDSQYKRLQYIRYADDFICGVIGSKKDAEMIKEDIKIFLADKLKLTLSEEKTKITHTSKFARFLSYDITVTKSQAFKKDKNGNRKRVYSNNIKLYVPHEKWVNKLKEYNAVKISKHNDGKELYRVTHRTKLINLTDIQILQKYNSEVRGLYNYYCIANNAYIIGKFGGLMYWSMCKTFAGKYKTKVSKIKNRYIKNGNFTVQYETKAGLKTQVFYNQGYKKKQRIRTAEISVLPTYKKYDSINSLANRIKSRCCE